MESKEWTCAEKTTDKLAASSKSGDYRRLVRHAMFSKKSFLLAFIFTIILQGMFSTYYISIMTTIEHRFLLQAKMISGAMTAIEVGQIFGLVAVMYITNKCGSSRAIAASVVVFCLSCVCCTLPHFIYGPASDDQHRLRVMELSSERASSGVLSPLMKNNTNSSTNSRNSSSGLLQGCTDSHSSDMSHAQLSVIAIFFISMLGIGLGQSVTNSVGMPHIDDSVTETQSPIYFAIVLGMKTLGPICGFLLGSLCTSLNAEHLYPGAGSEQNPTEQRQWQTAWWLGFFIISSVLLPISIFLYYYPSNYTIIKKDEHKKAKRKNMEANDKIDKIIDVLSLIKNLLKNRIFMMKTISYYLHLFCISGIYLFLSKYIETQYNVASYAANIISGMGGIFLMFIGIICGGIFTKIYQPSKKFISCWLSLVALLFSLGLILIIQLHCADSNSLDRSCVTRIPKEHHIQSWPSFSNTSHILSVSNLTLSNGTNEVISTQCSRSRCTNFFWFVLTFAIIAFIHSTSEVGSILFVLRCVQPAEKCLSMAIMTMITAVLGNIPGPIILGTLIDKSCIKWTNVCGVTGFCKEYDRTLFRYYNLGFLSVVMLLASIVDMVIYYELKRSEKSINITTK